MKKLFLVFASIVSVHSSLSFAQKGNQHTTPIVRFGKIAPSTASNANRSPVNTTREEILSDPRLIVDPQTNKVVSFTFSMLPKGRDLIGPFKIKGADFTPEIIKTLIEMRDPEGKILIEDIRVMEEDKMLRSYNSIILNLVSK